MKTKPAISATAIQEKRLRDEFEARIQPDRKTLLCESCGELHGLFYRIGSKNKKALMYSCAKQKHFWFTADPEGKLTIEHWRYAYKTFEAPVFVDGLDIPVEWGPGKKREHQKANQYAMPLMIPR